MTEQDTPTSYKQSQEDVDTKSLNRKKNRFHLNTQTHSVAVAMGQPGNS